MMYGRRKSSPVIVVLKTANKAEVSTSVAESEKRRAGAEGIVRQHTTRRAQYRSGVSHVLSRCGSTSPFFPKVGTVCGKAARTGLCGGREVIRVPTAPVRMLRRMSPVLALSRIVLRPNRGPLSGLLRSRIAHFEHFGL